MMGDLLMTMVANDAFTQALTNPLLARNVFREETFSATGMNIINNTKSLAQIVLRNASNPDAVLASFACPPAERARREESRPATPRTTHTS